MTEHELNHIMERHMATLNEKLDALTTAVTALTSAVAGIAKPEDLTPVENALAALQTSVTEIDAKIG